MFIHDLDSDARIKTGTLATVYLKVMTSSRFIIQPTSMQSILNVTNMGKFPVLMSIYTKEA